VTISDAGVGSGLLASLGCLISS